MLRPSRALAGSGVACLAALAVAGCSAASKSSSSSSTLTVSGNTLRIYLSEPSDLRSDPVAQDVVHAEQMAFSAHSKSVTRYKLALEPVSYKTLSDNARAAIIDSKTIAYLGEIAPGASDQTTGITNAQDVLQVSPTDGALELSQATPAVSGGVKSYFEQWSSYARTFARVVPSGAEEAKAQVAEMKSLGVTRLYVANDGSDYGRALADVVRGDAEAAGLKIEPSVGEEVNGYFYGGESPSAAAKFFNQIATTAPTAKLFGPASLNSSAFTSALSSAVHNLYVSIPGYLPKDLPAEGKAFVAAFKTRYGHTPNTVAIFGYEAMAALLRVLAHEGANADNRADVVTAFLKQSKVPSVLGSYSIDSSGNTSLDAFVFARMRAGKLVPFAAAPQG
ncbi:MAG TPA: ABC transporter substrate-binding protein [Solirubrobacteraceae bacterium]|nr:ABC transporter substrate-binding protein [Solirubrobacteraceae bacterium]